MNLNASNIKNVSIQPRTSGSANDACGNNQRREVGGEEASGQEINHHGQHNSSSNRRPPTLSDGKLPRSPAPWLSPQIKSERNMVYWWDRRVWQTMVPRIQTYIDHVHRLRRVATGGKVGDKAEIVQTKSTSEYEIEQETRKQATFNGLAVSEESSSRVGEDSEARRWSC